MRKEKGRFLYFVVYIEHTLHKSLAYIFARISLVPRRGIVMMQTFMDQVEFFHVGEGMLVKMTKYFGLPKRSQDGSCERPFSLEDAEEADAGPSGGCSPAF